MLWVRFIQPSLHPLNAERLQRTNHDLPIDVAGVAIWREINICNRVARLLRWQRCLMRQDNAIEFTCVIPSQGN